MYRIALKCIVHDRGRCAAAVTGIALSTVLLLVQLGIYRGLLDASSALVTRLGGDVWVMARGTEQVQNAEPLDARTGSIVAAHPCVVRARPVVIAWTSYRRGGGGLDQLQLVGIDVNSPASPVPWSLAQGLPADLASPDRVSIDVFDARQFRLGRTPFGATIEIGGRRTRIGALTRGIRSFALTPVVFASIATARRLAGLADGEASYWLLDLRSPACANDVVRQVERHRDLRAVERTVFASANEDYVVGNTGIGIVLGFIALLGFFVALVVTGQTLYAVTRDHERELAMLEVAGASASELVAFVAWQAAFVGVAGAAVGLMLAFAVSRALENFAVSVVLSAGPVAAGLLAVALVSVLASASSVRRVLALEPAAVLR